MNLKLSDFIIKTVEYPGNKTNPHFIAKKNRVPVNKALANTAHLKESIKERFVKIKERDGGVKERHNRAKERDMRVKEKMKTENFTDNYINSDNNAESNAAATFNNTKSPDSSIKLMDVDSLIRAKQNRVLHQCSICNINFVNRHTYEKHYVLNNHTLGIPCEECGFLFTKQTRPKHLSQHHGKGNFKAKDMFILKEAIYKCSQCSLHFHNYRRYMQHTCVVPSTTGVKCDFCQLFFSAVDITVHISLHRQNKLKGYAITSLLGKPKAVTRHNDSESDEPDDVVIDVEELENETSISAEVDEPSTSGNTDKIKFYKCGICNVYFLTQTSYQKHIKPHKELDPMEYIECKLCKFQFMYTCLHVHMKKHHINKEFKVEDVLIEEYLPKDSTNEPEVKVNNAEDRVQSGLVSTTSEFRVD